MRSLRSSSDFQGVIRRSPLVCPASQVRARLHYAPSSERAEAHMRSPWATAAPSSRILRAGLRKTGPFLTPAAEAIPYVGPSTWIRQGRSSLSGMPHPGILVASGALHRGTLDDHAGGHVPPERDQELPGERHDRDLLHAPAVAADPIAVPPGERRVRLVPEPEPRHLDDDRAQPRIAGLRHALLVVDPPALPRRRRQARVSGDLPTIVEVPEQPFRPERSGEAGPDALEPEQHRHGCRRRCRGARPPATRRARPS